MKLNKESPDEGYVPEQKSMIDPHTGNYVTIKHDKNTCTAEELPEGAKQPISQMNSSFTISSAKMRMKKQWKLQ